MRSGRPTGRSETVKVGAPSSSTPAFCPGAALTTQAIASKSLAALRKPRTLSAATDKVHYLQTVPLGQASIGPLNAGNNTAVMLDCHPVAFETKLANQVLQVG